MEEEDIGDDLWLGRLGGTSTETVQDASAHVTPVVFGGSSPDITDDADQGGEYQDRSSAEGGLDWDPRQLATRGKYHDIQR